MEPVYAWWLYWWNDSITLQSDSETLILCGLSISLQSVVEDFNTAMAFAEAQSLCKVIQRNCHISDARHASEYTLCVYLLKMREYFRWEMGYPFGSSIPKDEIGHWLSAREHLWETLETEPFAPIDVDGCSLDPFDTYAINRLLLPKGYVYSAGVGARATPHFFLGTLEKRTDFHGFTALISAQECARDLTAPPAMALGNTIFVRRESLKRFIWEKLQEWRWNKRDNALARAFSFYNFDADLEDALERMTTVELETVIMHEIGEVRAGKYLGAEWESMLLEMPRSKGEIMARAVRDHLADALTTLPGLLEQGNPAPIHFYAGNLTAMRRKLFPGFMGAYEDWLKTDRLHSFKALVTKGKRHWLDMATEMLELQRKHGKRCGPYLESLLEHSPL